MCQPEKPFTDLSHDSFSTIIISCAITLQIKNYPIWLRLEVISESARADLLKKFVRCRMHVSIFFLNHGASGSFGHTIFWCSMTLALRTVRHCETPDCGRVKQEQKVNLPWVSRQFPAFCLIFGILHTLLLGTQKHRFPLTTSLSGQSRNLIMWIL